MRKFLLYMIFVCSWNIESSDGASAASGSVAARQDEIDAGVQARLQEKVDAFGEQLRAVAQAQADQETSLDGVARASRSKKSDFDREVGFAVRDLKEGVITVLKERDVDAAPYKAYLEGAFANSINAKMEEAAAILQGRYQPQLQTALVAEKASRRAELNFPATWQEFPACVGKDCVADATRLATVVGASAGVVQCVPAVVTCIPTSFRDRVGGVVADAIVKHPGTTAASAVGILGVWLGVKYAWRYRVLKQGEDALTQQAESVSVAFQVPVRDTFKASVEDILDQARHRADFVRVKHGLQRVQSGLQEVVVGQAAHGSQLQVFGRQVGENSALLTAQTERLRGVEAGIAGLTSGVEAMRQDHGAALGRVERASTTQAAALDALAEQHRRDAAEKGAQLQELQGGMKTLQAGMGALLSRDPRFVETPEASDVASAAASIPVEGGSSSKALPFKFRLRDACKGSFVGALVEAYEEDVKAKSAQSGSPVRSSGFAGSVSSASRRGSQASAGSVSTLRALSAQSPLAAGGSFSVMTAASGESQQLQLQ